MQRPSSIIAALAALAVGFTLWMWLRPEPAPAASVVAAPSAPPNRASPARAPADDRIGSHTASPVEKPPAEIATSSDPSPPGGARDRAEWAQARRQIETALQRRRSGAGENEPPSEEVAGNLDKGYIRERVREDVVPLVQECYETLLERVPNTGGRMVLKFAIMGDESVGGIVDAVDLAEDSEIQDPDFRECLTESTMSAVFDPPEGGGRVEITYPFIFEAEASADAAAPG